MPNKDPEKRKQASKLRMQKMREGVTKQGVTSEGVTEETVPASYVQGLTGMLKTLPERPRYLTLSDGQVLDRANQPTPNRQGWGEMQAYNESAYNFKPHSKASE